MLYLCLGAFYSAARVRHQRQGGAYKNVVVWLHGLGDTADGWSGSMPALGVGDTKFILPTADAR